MSKQLISQYYSKVDKLIQFSGSRNEETVKSEFANLLNHYAEKKNLLLVRELPVKGTKGKNVIPDGVLKNVLRLDYGYWESKDQYDDLQKEIDSKQRQGYPFSNILFEDGSRAILFQSGEDVMNIDMRKPDELDRVLNAFITFKSPQIVKFDEALLQFKKDVPTILETLREKTDEAGKKNLKFIKAREIFLELCKAEINPDITADDIREMMIQHILTSDIFNVIFDDAEFFRHNNIAAELEKLINTFFTQEIKHNTLDQIRHYYQTINSAAASLADHHEKQKFLKALYEDFYKAYNPKAADRLGVVYTPNEIVDFMIDSTNYLLEKHFGKLLWDKNVEILDPATGTGTFICNMIDKCPNQSLTYKYKNELHANEVAILPYYIANLNIEYTYKQKMGSYSEFPGVCFVDTLDNTDALAFSGKQHSLFQLSSENARRIKEQNKKNFMVIIGNPPYNAKQENYNYQNSNRAYEQIDKRIKDTYIKFGTAQNQIVVYDMYTRFLRWSSDRVGKNGIIAFVSNNSFIDAQSFDGFRKSVADEFNELWIVNLKGNARTSGERRRRESGNIFSDLIRVGVAIYFLVRKENKEGFKVYYNEIGDYVKADEKKDYLKSNTLSSINFDQIKPTEKYNWINQSENDFDDLIPLIDKKVKAGTSEKAIFKLFSRGVATQRDEWVYDFSEKELEKKVKFMIDVYSKTLMNENYSGRRQMKWDEDLDSYRKRKIKKVFKKDLIVKAMYRPFIPMYLYFDRHFNGRTYQWFSIYNEKEQKIIVTPGLSSPKDFHTLSINNIIDLNALPAGCQCLSLYCYDSSGNRIENITDWGVEQFQSHYKDKKIKKEDIFHYSYAVLHNPAYRKKYEQNLKREFPRIPFYDDFFKWAKWGEQLMKLHINYETAKSFPLKEITSKTKADHKRVTKELFQKVEEPEALYARKPKIKVKLKADKQSGSIEIDEITTLTGIPKEVWQYKLGNRSALEWILDQYKEKKPKDPTIAEKFNTYRFADYKERVIDLIKRVITVSMETVRVVEEMEKEST